MIEGSVFATLAPLFRSQTNFFASQSPPSLFLAPLRTQAEPTPEGPRQPASLLESLRVQSYVAHVVMKTHNVFEKQDSIHREESYSRLWT
jgi:hypothetical protein